MFSFDSWVDTLSGMLESFSVLRQRGLLLFDGVFGIYVDSPFANRMFRSLGVCSYCIFVFVCIFHFNILIKEVDITHFLYRTVSECCLILVIPCYIFLCLLTVSWFFMAVPLLTCHNCEYLRWYDCSSVGNNEIDPWSLVSPAKSNSRHHTLKVNSHKKLGFTF